MYRANLSFTQLNEYLDFMLRIMLLEEVNIKNKKGYRPTDKGLDYIQIYGGLYELFGDGKNDIQSPPQHLLGKK